MSQRVISIILINLCISINLLSKDVKLIYVLPINDEIGSTTWLHTKNAVKEAKELNADYFLVHMNTYGGNVQHADSIRTALLRLPMPTIAYIDNNAASAGALIALACDSVFMQSDGTMGAVTVVNGNDGTQMPDKYQSYMRAMMRSTAERHGKDSSGVWRRDPLIAEAMVDSRIIVPGLIDSTKVLTFTPEEAIKWGYADGKANSIKDVLSQLDIHDYEIKEYKPSWTDYLSGFFTNPIVQSILIMIMVGGIYFELQTPGMGFPSVAALTAAILYFLPLYLTGIVSSWIVILFVIGIILLLLEIFVIPGFGVTGILGLGFMIVAIFIGLFDNFSFSAGEIDSSIIWKSLLTLGAGFALATCFMLYITSRYAPRFISRRNALNHVQSIEDGYIGVDTSVVQYIGNRGIAVTDMRPSGKIEVEGEILDGVSMSGFIPKGTPIVVMRHENAQLYVKTLN